MDCCQDSGSVRSQHYNDLESILANIPSYLQDQSSPRQQQHAPKLRVSLDLPGYAGYLPTYWPGQNITGEVQIHPDSPIKVTHLRVALFGNVQVYGNHPGHPMTNGLFDYRKNEQLVNTGLRIIRKSPATTATDTEASDAQQRTTVFFNDNDVYFETDQQPQDERYWMLSCRGRNSTEEQQQSVTAIHSPSHQQGLSNPPPPDGRAKKRPKKTPEDRHMEKLIRRVAAIDHTSNISHGLLHLDQPTLYNSSNSSSRIEESNSSSSSRNNTFQLNAYTHQIRFLIRVPTSRRLSGTFDHPHFPVGYRVVCIMKCKNQNGEDDNRELTCYSTVKLRLEPYIDINSLTFSTPIQTSPKVLYVQRDNRLMTGMYTYVLSSSSTLTQWMHRLTQWKYQKQKRVSPFSSYLQVHLELPKQAFERSQHIPLKLKFTNLASTHFKVSAVKMTLEFIRRINMTCSISEEVEGVVVQLATVLFKSSEEEQLHEPTSDDIIFFKHANLCFDLSKVIRIPDDCVCSIFSESTRDIFTLGYDVNVRLDVTGLTQKIKEMEATPNNEEEEATYIATDKHIFESVAQALLPKEEYHHKLKTYTLHLDPLNVIVGNTGYQGNNSNF